MKRAIGVHERRQSMSSSFRVHFRSATMATPRSLLLLFIQTTLLSVVTAYPKDWYFGSYGLSRPACDGHPTTAVAGSPHGSPQTDSGITFVFTDASSKATDFLCPGSTYNVVVSFSSTRLALLTGSSSSVAFTSPSATSGCTNRVDLGSSSWRNAKMSFSASFTVPCSAAGSSVSFKVTSAGRDRTWYQNTKTLSVVGGSSATGTSDCAAALVTCSITSGTSSPGTSSPSSLSSPTVLPSQPPPPAGTSVGSGDDGNDKLNDDDDDDEDIQAISNSSGGCTPSTLGYQCMTTVDKVAVHWTANTASAPKANGCTPTSPTVLQDSELSQYGTLHMAVQSRVTGYVSIGFSSNPKAMHQSDIVLGWAGGGSSRYLQTFNAQANDLDEADINPPAGSSSWAYDSGVVYNSSSGTTTICFSRRLLDSRATDSPDLRPYVGVLATSISNSSTTAGGRRRLSQASSGTASGQLGLIWAVSSEQALVKHTPANVGGFWLDVSSGAAGTAVDSERRRWMNAHGALMAVAWGLLLPLGTLLPAHRWVLGDAKLLSRAAWFVLHMVFQWTGVALFVAGFVIAYVKLESNGGGDDSMREAHEKIGIAVMAAAGAQVVAAYIRPKPGSPRRGLWNLLHHNLGRVTVLLAWANVYIGIYVFHTSPAQASYVEWITPIAIVMGLLVITDVALRIYARHVSSLGSSCAIGGADSSPGDHEAQGVQPSGVPGAQPRSPRRQKRLSLCRVAPADVVTTGSGHGKAGSKAVGSETAPPSTGTATTVGASS